MSYQPPNQPPASPQGGYPQFDYYQPDLLAPARRASTLMFVLGGLALLGSLCCGGVGVMMPQLMQQAEFATEMEKVPGATAEMMRIGMIVMGVLSLITGLVFIVLGVFVRRGSKAAAITAMVISILAALLMLANAISPMILGGGAAPQQRLGGLCVFAIPLALLGLLIAWLIGAMKASDQVTASQYAMQYWQYAQQQQQQAYGGYSAQQQQPPTQPGGPGEQPPASSAPPPT